MNTNTQNTTSNILILKLCGRRKEHFRKNPVNLVTECLHKPHKVREQMEIIDEELEMQVEHHVKMEANFKIM